MRPLVLHLDIDAFFASVEQLRNPRLVGRPVAVGTGVIASCSYEARHFGLRAGMPLRRAERLCPQLVVVEGHQAIYRCYAEQVFALCHDWAPQVEAHLDEAYCDLSGTERLYPQPLTVGETLRRRVHTELGLRVTVGMGRNRMFARLATRAGKPDGLVHLPAEAEEPTLLALALEDLPGIGPRTAELLGRLGIHTIAELRTLSAAALQALLGLPGRTLYERCRGLDPRVIERREVPQSIRRETTFHADTDDPREIDGMLHYLTERAARTLRARGLVAGALGVKIVYADHAREERRRRLAPPTQLDGVLVARALALRRELHQRRVALRHVGVFLERLARAPEAVQATLFSETEFLAGESPAAVNSAVHSAVHSAVNSAVHSAHSAVHSGVHSGSLPAGDVAVAMTAREPAPVYGASRPSQPPSLSAAEVLRQERLMRSFDRIRDRYGHAALITGRSLHLLGPLAGDRRLARDANGFVLRTPCLTQ